MSPARCIAAGVFCVALLIGTLRDRAVTLDAPVFDNGYWILASDFHVHSYPGDLGIAPWDLRREAARRGLDVIAITNHNQTTAGRLGAWVSRTLGGPIILTGEEITAANFHLIAVGITTTVSAKQSAADAIGAVHAQGGVAIAAHPVERFWAGLDDRAIAMLDGVEAAHPLTQGDLQGRDDLRRFHERARRLNPDVSPIGSSDFHLAGVVGWCRTYVLATERSDRGVLDAIRAGRTVAVDVDGHLHGDDGWVRRVEPHHASALSTPHATDVARVLVLTSAWLGLLGVLLLA
jgi:predicted metal-dependent phosphoesterase TrpH